MAIQPPDVHTSKFLNALDSFMESNPRLPDGAADSLKELGQTLRGYNGSFQSPGEQEAQKAGVQQARQPTDGTGVPFGKAATGQDVPSPGQREFEAAVGQMRNAVGLPSSENN